MRIRYHFLANLHITKTRFILFLTKYNKNNTIGWVKAYLKTGFSVNDWKSSKTLRRLKKISRCTLISGWGELFSKWENECPGQCSLKADCVPLIWVVSMSMTYESVKIYGGCWSCNNHSKSMHWIWDGRRVVPRWLLASHIQQVQVQ